MSHRSHKLPACGPSRWPQAVFDKLAACGYAALVLAFLAPIDSAEITSRNHPRLKEAVQSHPKADANKDGVLSFSEYRALRKTLGPRKQANGREAGPISTLLSNGDLLITDFEENNQGRMRQWGWTIEGDSFRRDFAYGTGLMKRRAEEHCGKYLLSSYAETEATTGRIVSPEFKIELRFIQFKLSGGDHPHRTCVNLMVDNKVLRTATGRNTDRFETVAFDVAALKGSQAKLEIVDSHTGMWGHINVDRVVQTDQQTAQRVIADIPVGFGLIFGTVQTFDKRRRGPLAITETRLGIGDETVDVNQLLLAICETESSSQQAQGALRLVNGEVWHGHPQRLEEGKVVLQSPLFKERRVPLDQIASIEFKPTTSTGGEPGTLYRDQGEPIPGKLVWIREKDIAIDCALGVVPVPRQSVQRLVLAKLRGQIDSTQDEVGLIDGSLLSGTLKIEKNKLVVEHGTLGALPLEWQAVSYVRRASKNVIWLDQIDGKVLERVGPALPPPAPEVLKSEDPGFLRVIRMMPGTRTRYSLPTGTSNRVFHAILAPVPGSKADVKVRLLDGDRVLWESQVIAGGEPVMVAVKIQQAKELVIEVVYSGPLAFPCGVDWRDPFVIEG